MTSKVFVSASNGVIVLQLSDMLLKKRDLSGSLQTLLSEIAEEDKVVSGQFDFGSVGSFE